MQAETLNDDIVTEIRDLSRKRSFASRSDLLLSSRDRSWILAHYLWMGVGTLAEKCSHSSALLLLVC